ncbi:membrane-associated protein, putative [Bodo saltans]|uniref:Membrane-associated protein, putative n=1 Tax=Bodo saltans TaxID=75058 RepID=A0A0S4KLP4_BODSA|nr:membrane-associated protein, putative [Bodo saltans]|eukprot:CUI15546.1 membrane-associated protein, putative [Bodo saltans]
MKQQRLRKVSVVALFTAVVCPFFIIYWSAEANVQPDENRFEDSTRNKVLLNNLRATPPPQLLTELFRWSGGGVHGSTEGEENLNLDRKMHKTVLRAFEAAFETPTAAADFLTLSSNASTTTTTYTKHRLSVFVKFFMANVALNTNRDCGYRLHPSQQLLCHVWAAVVHHHNNNNNRSSTTSDIRNVSNRKDTSSSSLFKGTTLHSMCSLFLACAEWKRGRYSIPLSSELLQSTFAKVANDTELWNSSGVLLRNLIHGGNNWREYDWLADRMKTSHTLIENHTSRVDVRSVFQGGEITTTRKKKTDVKGTTVLQQQLFSSRDNGESHFHLTRPLSSLETIAVLHHRATSGKPQMVVFPRRVGSVPSSDDATEECRVPAINVLLFSGDSTAHQHYLRLFDLIRHGTQEQGQVLVPFGTKPLRSNFRHWPTHDRSGSRDMILAIYPTHDEFVTFYSLMPYHAVLRGEAFVRSNNESVTAYFTAVAQRRAAKFCHHSNKTRVANPDDNNSGGTSLIEQDTTEEALFYLVFLADAITARPRTDALAPCVPAQPFLEEYPPAKVHNFRRLKEGVSRGFTLVHDPPVPSLRSLGIRIPMHVISANIWEFHESPTTYEWLLRMATGNCSVVTTTSTTAATMNATTTTTTLPPQGAAEEWRFGEHPASDATHLYRASTMLWLPPNARGAKARRRHSPKYNKTPTRGAAPFSSGPPTKRRELARLDTPFRWLHDAATKVIGSDPRKLQRTSEGYHHHRRGTFFSRLRVLDMGKVFLATGNVFHQEDGLHERCTEHHWLVGAASYRDTTRVLRTSAENLTSNIFRLLPPSRYRSNVDVVRLRFGSSDDCYSLGALLTLNALLLDIVQSNSSQKEEQG